MKSNPNPSKTPASVFQELCVKRGIIPEYKEVESTPPPFICQVICDGLVAEGRGRSKKEAKHEAASRMLEILKTQTNTYVDEDSPVNDDCVSSPFNNKMNENAVGLLSDLCTEYGLIQPSYESVREEGPSHARIFTYQCVVHNFCFEAVHKVKKQAKQLAASMMLTYLKQIISPGLQNEPTDISFIGTSREADFRDAIREFDGCSTKMLHKYHSQELTYELSTDHVKYQSIFLKNSETLQSLRNFDIKSPPENPVQYLIDLLQKDDISYSVVPLETNNLDNCMVVLCINLSPNVNIHATGATYVSACRKAAIRALQLLRNFSSQSKKPRPVESSEDFESLITVKKREVRVTEFEE